MKLLLRLTISAFFAISCSIAAQEAEKLKVIYPETEIFLFDLDLEKDKEVLSGGKNVTLREGYDNQPYFTKGSDSFLFSRGDDYQTDVYEYFLSSGETKRVTHSDATEFSPTPFPDNKSIAFVSNRSASIWYGSRDDIDNPKWAQAANDNREPIGYYAWNHKTGDILYWSQYGFSVSLVHESSQNYHFVTGNAVPSTPYIIPGTNNFSFVHRQTNGQVWIKEFNPKTKAVRPIITTVGENSNYCWTPDGSILMIENNMLYRWIPDGEDDWVQIADLSKFGIKNANRLAVSPNAKKLAVVGLPNGD